MLDKSKLHLEASIDKEGHRIQRWHHDENLVESQQSHGLVSIGDLKKKEKSAEPYEVEKHRKELAMLYPSGMEHLISEELKKREEKTESFEDKLRPGKGITRDEAEEWLDSIQPGGSKVFKAKGLDLHVGRRSDGKYYTGEGHEVTGAYHDVKDHRGRVDPDMIGKTRLADDLVFYSDKDHDKQEYGIPEAIRKSSVHIEHMPKMREAMKSLFESVQTEVDKPEAKKALATVKKSLDELKKHGMKSEHSDPIDSYIRRVEENLKKRKPDRRFTSDAVISLNIAVHNLDKDKNIPVEAKKFIREVLGVMDYKGMERNYHGIQLRKTEEGYLVDGQEFPSIEQAEGHIKAKLWGYEDLRALAYAEEEHHKGDSPTMRDTERRESERKQKESKEVEARQALSDNQYIRSADSLAIRNGSEHSTARGKLGSREEYHKEVANFLGRSEHDPLAQSPKAKEAINRTKDKSMRAVKKDIEALNSYKEGLEHLDQEHLDRRANDVQSIRTMHHNAASNYERHASTGEHTDLHTAHSDALREADNALGAIRLERNKRDELEKDEKEKKELEAKESSKQAEIEIQKEREARAAEIRKKLPPVTDEHKRMYPDTGKWKEREIEVSDRSSDTGRRSIKAKTRGVWALHAPLSGRGVALTHIPTGMGAGVMDEARAHQRAVSEWLDEDKERAHKGAFSEFEAKGEHDNDMMQELGLGHVGRLLELRNKHGK